MANLHTVWLGIDMSCEVLELLDELRGLSCGERAFASFSGGEAAMHFSSLADATAFVGLFSFLLEEMTGDERAKTESARGR
ncbi:hypothetical protein [Parvibaculum sp.]|uniref:hypothetical protein n=1 Tax=Parvibaculum sp. TaxID=2024848 RepID=UPI0034A0689C